MITQLGIAGYPENTIGEHCKLLFQQGLVNNFIESHYLGNKTMNFQIGNLTAQGYDYLELIRDDKTWEKTKKKADVDSIPKTVTFLSKIAGTFAGSAIKEIIE